MSIKNLFDSTNKSTKYLADTDEKDAFKSVESGRNVEQLHLKQQAFIPQIDYEKPAQFAKFGSAYLYYKSAFNRILDYYPYDGSDAEINKFYNNCLDIEKYILNNLYPRRTGYGTLGSNLATPSSLVSKYGLHASTANREYIELYGGPGTGSGDTAVQQSPNPYNDKQQYSNIYDENIYQTAGLPDNYGKGTRTSNLRANFNDGVTLEFWLKTGSYNGNTHGSNQVVFDLWNSALSSSADYGRLSLILADNGGGTKKVFKLTAQSGTVGVSETVVGDEIEFSSLANWQHYAVTIQNSGSSLVGKVFVTGTLAGRTVLAASTLGELDVKPPSVASPGVYARIGSLITAPSGTVDDGGAGAGLNITDFNGAGRLSASVDEFRYWKTARNPEEIGVNWFTQIRGGVNTDIANATLGVYYKFNEGITGHANTDKVVLDYAGRITNGFWTGYTSTSRNTGSAILSASAATSEYEDPVIRKNNPAVVSVQSDLEKSGSIHDLSNNSNMLSLLPGWIIDDEEPGTESNVQNMCHIVGAYFDKLYLQISALPALRQLTYTSASQKPISFAEHLPQSLGLYSPELFVDASVLEKFGNRTDTTLFEGDLNDVKNEIYLNIYNNLTNIFKSKGTERAIRNVFRCFNIDQKLIKLVVNSHNNEFLLSNNLQQVLVNQPSLNLNSDYSMGGVVYQCTGGVSNSEALGYITPYRATGGGGTPREAVYGMTAEANIIFPYYSTDYNLRNRPDKRVSLFGITTVDTGSTDSKTGANTGFIVGNTANFQVRAVKEGSDSKNIYFELTSAYGPNSGHFPYLTSSKFLDVYNNEEWNLSVRVKPSDYPYSSLVSGSGYTDSSATDIVYDVIFHGTNTLSNRALNSFTVSGTMTSSAGVEFLGRAKRMYVGAERTNVTGALLYKSDVLIPTARYWLKYLDNSTLLNHSLDSDNIGISASIENISAIDTKNRLHDIANHNMLALDWKFNLVTGSDAGGHFTVQDFSSGSAEIRNNFGWAGKIAGYQHPGLAMGFATSSADVVSREPVNTYRFVSPEQVIASDMVNIFDDTDLLFEPSENIPSYFYSIEKSMYGAISEEMLDFMAGVIDFHEVIGAPVNRYRINYKQMEALRSTFFRRVTSIKEVEKYIDYYKWFDESVSDIIKQLIPATIDFGGDVSNIIESHVLERNKYKSVFPTLKFYDPDLDVFMRGIGPLTYEMPGGLSPVGESPRPTRKNELFWKARALPSAPEITSGNSTIDSQRRKFKDVIYTTPHLDQSKVILSKDDGVRYLQGRFPVRNFAPTNKLKFDVPNIVSSSIRGGVNFEQQKNIDFVYTALRPAGPVNTAAVDGGQLFVPENVLMAFSSDLRPRSEVRPQGVPQSDASGSYGVIDKTKKYFKVNYGREFQSDNNNYFNVKSDFGLPFNIISSSVTTGYNALVVERVTGNLEITNLHNDVYGNSMERPMQGAWPEHAVGGHQSRHIALNISGSGKSATYRGLDDDTTRAEAWRILLGRCTDDQGAIGMVGPDYPFLHQNQRHYTIVGCANTNTKAAYWTNTTNDSIMANTSSAAARAFVTGSRTNGGFTFTGWLRFPPNTESPDFSDIWSVGRCGGTSEGLFLFKKGKSAPAGSSACAGSGSGNWLGLDVQTRSTDNASGGGTARQIQYRAYLTGSPNVLNDGDWHHVAVALSGTNGSLSSTLSCSIYVDGTKLISCRNDTKVVQNYFDQKIENFGSTGFMHYGAGDAFNFSSTATIPYQGDEFMVVGGNSYTSTTNQTSPFSGAMDQLVFWTTPLTDAQISIVYNDGVPPDITGSCLDLPNATYLHAWYKMGEGASPAGTQDDDIPAGGNDAFSSGSNVIWDMSGKQNHMWTFNPAGTTAAPQIDLSTGTGYTPSSVKAGTTEVSTLDHLRSRQYPATSSQKAYLYRDFIAKTPYVFKNIQETTSSRGTIPGNYKHNYQIVATVGAWSNPRHFVDNQPTLPAVVTSSGATIVNTYLSRQRTQNSHFDWVGDYSTAYLTGAKSKSVITARFSNPGGIGQMTRGFQDFRSTEYSVYNQTNYRNLSLFMESQVSNVVYGTASYGWDTKPNTVGKTASAPQIVGRVDDILGKGDGLRAHLSRHTAKFGRDSLYQAGTSDSPTAPRAQQAPGATYVQWPNFHKVHRNTLPRFELNAAGVPATASVHDNYFVQHPIPRSDKQYAWITGCLDVYTGSNDYPMPIRYSGYQRTGPISNKAFYSSSRGYEPFFNFVSESQVSGATVGSAALKLKQPIARLVALVHDPIRLSSAITSSSPYIYIPARAPTHYGPVCNIVGYPVYSRTSTSAPGLTYPLGYYINKNFPMGSPTLDPDDLIKNIGGNENANVFNLVMAKRENNYGWTWRSSPMRRGMDQPILMEEKRRNLLSAASGTLMNHYWLPPISVAGRPVKANLQTVYRDSKTGDPVKTTNMSFKVSHNNEKIFFNNSVLNNLVNINYADIVTPFNNFLEATKSPDLKLNWVIYGETIFPSRRNEFVSSSMRRQGYDNHFWRASRKDRTSDLYGTYGNETHTFNSIQANKAILSMWPLDAPSDFLTRTTASVNSSGTPIPGSGPRGVAISGGISSAEYQKLRQANTAGELQSTYFSYFTGCFDDAGFEPAATTRYNNYINNGIIDNPGGTLYPSQSMVFATCDQLTLSSLYARKHMNAARYSVVTPNSIVTEGTGVMGYYYSGTKHNNRRYYEDVSYNTFKSGGAFFPVQTYSGEALWEAPTDAGVLRPAGTSKRLYGVFHTRSMEPWGFDTYTDYIQDMNLVARGFSVVPEFRISEHVEDYTTYGAVPTEENLDILTIPGTGITSATSSFYTDYSNSEFLNDFLNIKEDTLLGAKEVRLVCSAAIRYNPYKGFYPVQRTLDLNRRFLSSYVDYINVGFVSGGTGYVDSFITPEFDGGNFAPLWRTMFAPGLMYNTIKSGMAIDYPVVTEGLKLGKKQNFAGMDQACGLYPLVNTTGALSHRDYGYKGGEFFDKRLPFETLVNPTQYLDGLTILDLESHLSSAVPFTCSWTNGGGDVGLYPMMASNFFGEVGNFFLKDSGFTRLESNVVPTDLRFETGSVYGARIRMNSTTNGMRNYTYEEDSRNQAGFGKSASGSWAPWGARVFTASHPSTHPYEGGFIREQRGWGPWYPVPQHPKNLAMRYEFKQNFIMYSRPSAFGPPVSGRSHTHAVSALTGAKHGTLDSFEGYNWAFTPPYTNGECWADLIFWPKGDKSYDLEQILAETHVRYWRVDPGPRITAPGAAATTWQTALIEGGPGSYLGGDNPIYGGPNVNSNAMQLSASLNLFGVEPVFKVTKDKFGDVLGVTSEVLGKKWIIQPKFETPILNFCDEDMSMAGASDEQGRNPRPISVKAGTLTLPTYGSASVPRGMWHQFGSIPVIPEKGIFMDIGPIPQRWLKYHYQVLNTGSIYNNYDLSGTRRKDVWSYMKPLSELGGFERTGQQKRLGELKNEASIREAVVAVPYVVGGTPLDSETAGTPSSALLKQFIEIPEDRLQAAMALRGSREGDSLAAAGSSIRKLIQKMERYILPPPFDFVNNRDLTPVVMYMFEFEYKFDRDDLSYMWQNLAPRNSKKMFFTHSSIAHELMPTELLTEKVLLENQELRWMVFKVKQRSKAEYYDMIPAQAGAASPDIPDPTKISPTGYKIQYNWPYDYLSFVELIKMDVEVMYKAEDVATEPEITLGDDSSQSQDEEALKKAEIAAKKSAITTERAKKEPSKTVKTKGK